MIDLTLLLCIALGFLLGVLSGLTPGLHINNFAAMLLALSPLLLDRGFTAYHMASIILAASISQTFFDVIPAVFVGAPDADSVLAVLPGHRLMMEGRGIEAVRLSAFGSAGAVLISLILIVPISRLFYSFNDLLLKYVGVLLLLIALMMIRTENGPRVEGQGSLVHLKYKAIAAMLFLTSGVLGSFAMSHETLFYSPFGLEPQPLLPLLSGLFGASTLILSLSSSASVPRQRETKISLPPGALARSILLGGLGGSIVAWIPGVSPSLAAMTARLGTEATGEEFLVSLSGVNTANALFSLIALYVIDKPRSGAVAAIKELMPLSQDVLVQMVVTVVAVAAISYIAAVSLARTVSDVISSLNYRALCLVVLAGLTGMCLAFTGPFGLLIFVISTTLGLVAPVAGIKKTHAMGVLMLPLIVYYI